MLLLWSFLSIRHIATFFVSFPLPTNVSRDMLHSKNKSFKDYNKHSQSDFDNIHDSYPYITIGRVREWIIVFLPIAMHKMISSKAYCLRSLLQDV